ncbi:hypothetical protein ACWDOP_16340 [Nocardia sp. NPDC003693]
MAIQGFLNIFFDTVAPNRGWRYCGMCDASGSFGYANDGSVIFCSVCGGTGWLTDAPSYDR